MHLPLPLSMQFILVRDLRSQSFYHDTWFHAEFHEACLHYFYQQITMMLKKTFKAKSFSERKSLLSNMLARVRTRYGACGLHHQQQGWVVKTGVAAALGLAGLFYTMSLEKKDVSCFERIYIGCG